MTKPKKAANVKPKADKTAKAKVKREPLPEVEVTPSVCPGCGSTDREGYAGTRARNLTGILNGRPYRVVIWKPTKCRNCGKRRIDVYHLDRAYKASDGKLLGPAAIKPKRRR
jgi:predicted Zn-ribbon and HTH transcriptional regulator